MKKATIYLDTTVISAYWYEGHDVLALARRIMTREWWEHDRYEFSIWTSKVTLIELQAGKYPRQGDAVALAERLRLLTWDRASHEFARHLAASGIVPPTKPNDAMQMAIASVHRIDYLLTWNYSHLANLQAQRRLEELCREAGYRAPAMVTPESIPTPRLGQTTRRARNDDD